MSSIKTYQERTEAACTRCLFHFNVSGERECRRMPPVSDSSKARSKINTRDVIVSGATFPKVSPFDWCGEFMVAATTSTESLNRFEHNVYLDRDGDIFVRFDGITNFTYYPKSNWDENEDGVKKLWDHLTGKAPTKGISRTRLNALLRISLLNEDPGKHNLTPSDVFKTSEEIEAA